MSPVRFGQYELLERIGGGGMAEVFKARASGLAGFEKIVAIKRVLPQVADDAEFVSMFVEEARISANLSHANIAQVIDFGRIEETYFLAMEFIRGKDLRRIQRQIKASRKTLPVPLAVFVASGVCGALEYGHNQRDAAGNLLRIVHCDVSPQNVLLSYEGEVKLIDFGIARALNRSSRKNTGFEGKYPYMSPEQVEGKAVDPRTDLFSLGIVLYECVTGQRLFDGDNELAILDKVRRAAVPPPTKVNPFVPKPLEAILLKALARDPAKRYQTASELHEALEEFAQAHKLTFSAMQLARWMKSTFATDLAGPDGEPVDGDSSPPRGAPVQRELALESLRTPVAPAPRTPVAPAPRPPVAPAPRTPVAASPRTPVTPSPRTPVAAPAGPAAAPSAPPARGDAALPSSGRPRGRLEPFAGRAKAEALSPVALAEAPTAAELDDASNTVLDERPPGAAIVVAAPSGKAMPAARPSGMVVAPKDAQAKIDPQARTLFPPSGGPGAARPVASSPGQLPSAATAADSSARARAADKERAADKAKEKDVGKATGGDPGISSVATVAQRTDPVAMAKEVPRGLPSAIQGWGLAELEELRPAGNRRTLMGFQAANPEAGPVSLSTDELPTDPALLARLGTSTASGAPREKELPRPSAEDSSPRAGEDAEDDPTTIDPLAGSLGGGLSGGAEDDAAAVDRAETAESVASSSMDSLPEFDTGDVGEPYDPDANTVEAQERISLLATRSRKRDTEPTAVAGGPRGAQSARTSPSVEGPTKESLALPRRRLSESVEPEEEQHTAEVDAPTGSREDGRAGFEEPSAAGLEFASLSAEEHTVDERRRPRLPSRPRGVPVPLASDSQEEPEAVIDRPVTPWGVELPAVPLSGRPAAVPSRRPVWVLPVVLSTVLLALAAAAAALYVVLGRRSAEPRTTTAGSAVGVAALARSADGATRPSSAPDARVASLDAAPKTARDAEGTAAASDEPDDARDAGSATEPATATPDAAATVKLRKPKAQPAVATKKATKSAEPKGAATAKGAASGSGKKPKGTSPKSSRPAGTSAKGKKKDAASGDGTAAKGKPGYLIVASRPSAKVLVDGRATGLKTPVPPVSPLKLAPGRHKITLVVGTQRFHFTVEIRPGQTSKLAQILPVAP
ncbi:MAG: protein kinase [Deltaproteobacteria bacterium]|nr:protein kinase [Deltaproteobacteria bacterium]